MKLRNSVSPAAIALIKRFEGLRRTATKLDDGRWTIGYGHTRSAREGASVSEADAEALLSYDLMTVQAAVNDWTFTPLTQNQFDALVSFVFNIGVDTFRNSTVLRRVNEGAMLQAACAMELWRTADFGGERIVVDALVRRRAAEKALFLTPDEGFIAVSSALVHPRLDCAVASAPPVSPAELRANPEDEPLKPAAEPAPEPGEASDQRAAEALTARLQALWPEESTGAPEGRLPEAPLPAEELSAAEDRQAAEVVVVEPTEPDAVAGREPEPQPALHVTPVHSVRSIFEDTRPARNKPGFAPLVILGLIGLALFGGGLVWALQARPTGNLIGPAGIGFSVGVLGVACVASAVYFVLDRLSSEPD